MSNIHASCVCWQKKGILLLGSSGSGKSDLSLRLIQEYGAVLVADDRVDLNVSHETIYASAPLSLKSMLEVRGVGIVKAPSIERCPINIVVELVSNDEKIERLPENNFWNYEEIQVPLLRLHAFEASIIHKIIVALSWSKLIK